MFCFYTYRAFLFLVKYALCYNNDMSSPLYVRSCFSLLESVVRIEELVTKTKALGFGSVALVDHNIMGGSVAFYRACLKQNLKPIFGLDFDILYQEKRYSVILYALDDEGYVNLMHLSSYLMCEKDYVTIDELGKYRSHNLLVIPSDSDLYRNDLEIVFKELESLLGEYYIGICGSQYIDQRNLNNQIKLKAQKYGIKTFALNKTYYLDKEDAESYKVLRAIKEKKTIDDKDLCDELGHHFLSPQEMQSLFSEDDLVMSDYIASMCNVKMEIEKTTLPKYECQNGISSRDYLVNLARVGLNKRLKGRVDDVYTKRLNHELKIIISMHFEDYFLIVYDFILFAKRNKIYVGPGRGSAAGSLVSYCLGITDIDPIKYGLIFERFLNPERISMPDIDVDFPDNKRDEVIAYVANKYGKNHVAHIITYGTLQARQVLRDVARVLGYDKIDALCKAVPNDLKITLKRAYEESKYFRQKIDLNEESRHLYELCLKLEGLPRHASTHAAGIVMSLKALDDVVPLVRIENGLNSTGYTMEYLEDVGLIKMDFLGLRNLSIIAEITNDIKNDHDFAINRIPLNDQKTFDLIKDVRTLGVFQLESSGMQALIRKMRPNTFEDIALTIALFRPGPMENIPLYLENRANPHNIDYLHPDLKPILESTSGIIIYQEQIMTIARKMAGFTYAKADIMRKAMSKKKLEELSKLQDDFILGCTKRGYDKKIAENIYALILKFANYGFNKSHSIAYARIAYELAYLKANYPLYFYKALLNGVIGSSAKTYEYISECMRIKQRIKGPSINASSDVYVIEGNSIRMPISIIKNVGNVYVSKILEERKIRGPFKDYHDAVLRLKRHISRPVFESLIDAGAFDEFAYSHKTMLNHLSDLLKQDEAMVALANPDFMVKLIRVDDNLKERIIREKEVLGFNFAINPLLEYKKQYNLDTKPFSELAYENGDIKGFGIIQSIREYTTKTGEKMCFITVSDDTGNFDLVVRPHLYQSYKAKLIDAKKKYVYFEGEVKKIASCTIRKLEIKE